MEEYREEYRKDKHSIALSRVRNLRWCRSSGMPILQPFEIDWMLDTIQNYAEDAMFEKPLRRHGCNTPVVFGTTDTVTNRVPL